MTKPPQVSLFESIGSVAFAAALVALIGGLITVAGCTPEQRPAPKDPVTTATEAMDRGDYDTGISKLENHLIGLPDDDRARMALASGYMSRAKLTIDRFYKFGETFFEPEPAVEMESVVGRLTERIRVQTGGERSQIADFVVNLELFLRNTDLVLRRIDQIPSVDEKQLLDVKKALEHLENLRNATGGQLLYRAIARLVNLKAELSPDHWLKFAKMGLCEAEVSTLQNFLDSVHVEISQILDDAKRALPKSREKIAKISTQVSVAHLQITTALSNFSPVVLTLQMFLQNLEPLQKSGKAVSCEF